MARVRPRWVRGRVVVLAAAAALLALLTLTAVELIHEFDSNRTVRAELNRSYETRLQIQRVFSLLQDAETGQRGYVITGDPAFLQPYDDATADLERQIDRLDRLVGTEPGQLADLARLRVLTDRKVALMQASIVARATGGAEAGMAIVAAGQGKAVMDQAREVVARMVAAEAAALDAYAREAERRTARTEAAVALLFAAFLVSVALAVGLTWRYLRTRRAMLTDLRATTTRQQAVFDSAMDAILTLNPSGSIETVNAAAERMFGYPAAELDRRDVALLMDVAPDHGSGPAADFLARLGTTEGSLDEGLLRSLDARRRDGEAFPVDVALKSMHLPGGTHVVAIVRDVTERRRVEQMKTEFVSTVSHELRTPLTSIAGSLGLLTAGAAGALPDKAARLIQIAHANSQRLVRLINDILDVEKIESGKMRLELSDLDLRDIARRSIEGVQGYAQGLNVALTLADGPDAPVRGDADRLIQVVTNLLSNAAKFSPTGGEVRVTVDPSLRTARLSVRDDGPGVPEAFRSRIFTKFAQADGSDTRARGGTGLGLVIARDIAERHGGRLWFESREGEGATFHLDLPLALALPTEAAATSPRLLIVEDDADAAQVLREMLERDGFAADIVSTGRDALSAARTGDYRALLVDLNLPDANGISLIRALRARADTRSLPVVVVSGDVARGRARGRSLEVVDWLEKPFDQARLRDAVAAVGRRGAALPRILHVDDDRDILEVTRSALSGLAEVVPAESLATARQVLRTVRPDLVILDLGLPDGSGLDLLDDLGDEAGRAVPVVVYSAQEMDGTLSHRVEAVLTKSRTALTGLTQTVRRLTQDA